jgi:hypothetical protein
MDNYNYFRNTINKINKKIFWFDYKGKNIISGLKKTDTLKKFIKKIPKKENKYIRLVVSFHSGSKFYQGGKIQINITTYKVVLLNKKYVMKRDNIIGLNGSLWISNYWLESNIINNKIKLLKLLKNIISKIIIKKSIVIPGINLLRKLL